MRTDFITQLHNELETLAEQVEAALTLYRREVARLEKFSTELADIISRHDPELEARAAATKFPPRIGADAKVDRDADADMKLLDKLRAKNPPRTDPGASPVPPDYLKKK